MTRQAASERPWLSDWVQSQHTSPEAAERHRSSFAADSLHLLVLEDFLVETVAAGVADFLSTEAEFTRQCAIIAAAASSAGDEADHHGRLVSEAEWASAAAEHRFLRFGVGPGQPTGMSVGWERYLSLRSALCDARFARYIETLTGLALGRLMGLSAHAMTVGDMLAPHSDVNPWRRLALILYLGPDWRTEYGGALLLTGRDDAITRIEPIFNTLVLFEVTAHKSHCVEPISGAAEGTRRLSLGGWFIRPLSER